MANDRATAPTSPSRPDPASVHAFFIRYAREFERGLSGAPDLKALADLYAEAFVASAPAGVIVGHNDAELARVTEQGFLRYRGLGMTRMVLEEVTTTPIDALHALAHTTWRALYAVGNEEKSIRFTNVYLVRVDASGALKVFGWITGDEAAAMREHGIGAAGSSAHDAAPANPHGELVGRAGLEPATKGL